MLLRFPAGNKAVTDQEDGYPLQFLWHTGAGIGIIPPGGLLFCTGNIGGYVLPVQQQYCGQSADQGDQGTEKNGF